MNWLSWAAVIIAALYMIFAAGPAVASFVAIFCRKKPVSPEERMALRSYYDPHKEAIRSAIRELEALPSREVTLTARDGAQLKGNYYDGGFTKTAIFFHGYMADPMTLFCVQGRDLYAQGFNLLLVCQRGHGQSGGRWTTMGLTERYDVCDWTNWVKENTKTQKVLLYGISMGAAGIAFSAPLLDESFVRGMVLDCGYRCVYDQLVRECAVRKMPYWAMLFMVGGLIRLFFKARMKEKTTDALAKTNIPALFFQGTADETVSLEHAQQCYEACASKKEYVLVEGAAHTMAYLEGGDRAKKKLREFALETCI